MGFPFYWPPPRGSRVGMPCMSRRSILRASSSEFGKRLSTQVVRVCHRRHFLPGHRSVWARLARERIPRASARASPNVLQRVGWKNSA
eukprot:1227305-Lingulodinium_polyedra.AAC.1